MHEFRIHCQSRTGTEITVVSWLEWLTAMQGTWDQLLVKFF